MAGLFESFHEDLFRNVVVLDTSTLEDSRSHALGATCKSAGHLGSNLPIGNRVPNLVQTTAAVKEWQGGSPGESSGGIP